MKSLLIVPLTLLLFLLEAGLAMPSRADSHGQKAVLVTGATSGIGRSTAELLAKQGYFVYAGARKDADMAKLNKIENTLAVRLDVTNQEQIDAAVARIEKEGRGLWGVVNNAGVNVVAPLVAAREDEFQFLFNVNVFGVHRVTKAFAPLVVASKGRIVNVSSISGILSGPNYGMYSASKHALEAMTDALASEMEPFGVHVSAVNPGNFASEIGLTRCKRRIANADTDDWGLWEDLRQSLLKSCGERLKDGIAGEGTPPTAVAETISRALFEESPRLRYMVVPEQFEAGLTISAGMIELLLFNGGHEHSYTREEMRALVDLAWPYGTGEKAMISDSQFESFMEDLGPWLERKEAAGAD
ncbi:MAG: SDR family NAD(P)-dependent oxidoreductase [Pseudomonadota bacterium]